MQAIRFTIRATDTLERQFEIALEYRTITTVKAGLWDLHEKSTEPRLLTMMVLGSKEDLENGA